MEAFRADALPNVAPPPEAQPEQPTLPWLQNGGAAPLPAGTGALGHTAPSAPLSAEEAGWGSNATAPAPDGGWGTPRTVPAPAEQPRAPVNPGGTVRVIPAPPAATYQPAPARQGTGGLY